MIEIIYTYAPGCLLFIGMWIGGFMVGYGTARLKQSAPSSHLTDHIIRTTGKH